MPPAEIGVVKVADSVPRAMSALVATTVPLQVPLL